MNDKAAYPCNWPKMARRCKVLANWRCKQCGIREGDEYVARSGRVVVVHLHAAHLDHDKGNPSPRLRCLCPTCHGLYDWYAREREADLRLEVLRHRMLLRRRRKGVAA